MFEKLHRLWLAVNWCPMKSHAVYLPSLQATSALLKFYEDHGGGQFNLLRECLAALEQGNRQAVEQAFKKLHRGMSHHGWTDWFPPVVSSQETEAYVQTVFEALVERWYRLLRLLLDIH
ncbi:MAG: hypothetical protein ABSH20_03090 [Tepidisphaeraceae bacterium]|jgi:hypothetical protein